MGDKVDMKGEAVPEQDPLQAMDAEAARVDAVEEALVANYGQSIKLLHELFDAFQEDKAVNKAAYEAITHVEDSSHWVNAGAHRIRNLFAQHRAALVELQKKADEGTTAPGA